MNKKLKDMTPEEIQRVCSIFKKDCRKMIAPYTIGCCPFLTSNGIFGRCVLKTKAWQILNREFEIDDKQKVDNTCTICHADISKELPKIDEYGNHFCAKCYAKKCEYELLKSEANLKGGNIK